ncbi:MAG: hypothetical protein COB59_07625 [Rhodospirillaceae bacterium]|nr:MAG: hypothetical protein COB59_07625 [Rhodospirillaceae bacterium]
MAKILCIDDEVEIRNLLIEELEEEGHEVSSATNGKTGLAHILEHKPDLVLCDVSMPVMNGYELLKELRTNHPSFSNTAFIFLSANANMKDIISGLSLGADDYMTKPVNLELLTTKINSALRQVTRMNDQHENDLNEVIAEREHVEDVLMLTEQELKNANQVKSDFISCMNHELRTPLNHIIGFAEILSMDKTPPLSPEQKEYVDHILSGGKRLSYLVNEILNLSKLNIAEFDLMLETTNLTDVIRDSVDASKSLAAQHNITVHNEIDVKGPICVLADRSRLKQAFFNLLSNAFKFNSDGGTVTLTAQETTDHLIRVSVQDTGIGIHKNKQHAVFALFDRSGVDPLVTQDGIGIGLTVTRHLIERMQGRVGLESEFGVGSTFWIELQQAQS